MKQKSIILLCLLIIITGGVLLGLSKSQEVMTSAHGLLQAQLTSALGNALGTPTKVGQIQITSYNTITVDDITIYDKQSQALFASDRIKITYSLLNMLRGQNPMDAISEVVVEKPTLCLTQGSNGQWNIQEISKQENTSSSSFGGKVKWLGGRVVLNTSGTTWTLEDVSGNVDFAHMPRMELEVQATHKGAAVKVTGSVNSQGRSTLTVRASELFLADYQSFLPEGSLDLVAGSVKNIEVTVAQDKGNTEWAGEASLDGVDVGKDGMAVRQVQGNIAFTNKNVYVFATAKVFDQPIDIRGNVRIDASQPILQVMVASDAFDSSVIPGNDLASGTLSFKADITGIASNPIVNGKVELATGQIAGYVANHVQVDVGLANKQLTIHHCSGDILGGHIVATGAVQLETNSYQLHLTAQQIDLGNAGDFIPDSSGRGEVDVTVRGTGDFAQAEVQGAITIHEGVMADVPFHSFGVGFYRHHGITDIDYAHVGLGQGMVTASGGIDQQTLHLTVDGTNISLQQLNKQTADIISGTGNFTGQITGTLAKPQIAANFTATNGQVLYQPFTRAEGNLRLADQQVVIEEIRLVDGITKHKVQGTLSLEGQHEINIIVRSRQARAENIIKLLAPGQPLTGNVDHKVTLTGPLENFNAKGRVTLTDGSFGGQLISKAQGTYQREQGTTTIDQFTIYSLDTQIKLSGSISPQNDLSFDMDAQDVDLERLHLKLPYATSGRAHLKGKLTGTTSVPLFNGQFSADKLVLNDQEIRGVAGRVNFNGHEIDISSLDFKQGAGIFSFAGGFDMDTKEVYGSLDVENAEIHPILAVLTVPEQDMNGLFNGHMRLEGTLQRPNVWLTGDLKAGHIKKYPLESVAIDISLENNILTIKELSAKQGNGILVARGTADLDGPLDVEVGGRDIDAGLVASLCKTEIKPTGTIGFAAQVSGVASNPHTAVSLDIANGGVGSTTFDSLYGLLILDNNTIHVNQVLLKKGPYRASAYGVIPMAALSSNGRKQADITDQMNLKLRLDEANLSILPLLTKEVSWAEGQTQGEVTVTGTLVKPVLTGNVTIHNGVVKLAALESPIQKVGVDISFENDTINIKKFDGHMGSGLYSLAGTAKLQGIGLSDYHFTLALDKPEIRSKYFTGAVNGNLALINKGNKPQLSGNLLFENDTINIPGIPETTPSKLDVDLDIGIKVGKKVRFYNPYLYDIMTEGAVRFSGNTLAPDFSGSIVAVRGTVSYLKTQFKILEGRVDFKKFASFDPTIKLSAQTSLQQTVVSLNISGSVSAMQFGLTSEPAMRQQEIISLLTLRSRYVDKQTNGGSSGLGQSEVASALGAGLQMQFLSAVEENFRSSLGLDEFQLVSDTESSTGTKSNTESKTSNQEVYNIQLSKYLTDRLLLTYTAGVDHTKRDFALRYTLGKRTNFTFTVDEVNKTSVGLENRFRF